MKKIISFLLILTLSFSFLACGGDKRTRKKDDSNIVKKEEAQMIATEKEYEALIGNLSAFPVNFVYGDICYSGFAPSSFQEKSRTDITKGNKRSVVINFSLDETLSVILDTAFYKEYNAYEWTVYFKNENPDKASKTVKYVNAVDMYFKCENPVLKGLLGDHVNQYKPYEYDLKKEAVNFTSTLGRASHVYFPYFNLETNSGGMMLALGWAGTWQADKHNVKKVDNHFILEGINTLDYGEGMKDIYALDGASVLDIEISDRFKRNVNIGEVKLASNDFGSGRGVYLAGLPYSFTNARLLFRIMMYSCHKEEQLCKAYSSNVNTECNYYGDNLYAILNNTKMAQKTEFYDILGNKTTLELLPMEIKWIKN